ncbi:hypothetical protein THAOC_03635 [Thalassiosira oceanica]|uniref:Uncharacterized protein n=1 Tax=Thalassiosira oceanica TaxID=159749 RepID=K0TC33_THAOC|nr:hypothetical protein THAOC_03635 [Thalassiosira oceanica]|eukprot:EJK74674.1 hypothetical protein THAOC_03635 [Thalassiosira oceanica]
MGTAVASCSEGADLEITETRSAGLGVSFFHSGGKVSVAASTLRLHPSSTAPPVSTGRRGGGNWVAPSRSSSA